MPSRDTGDSAAIERLAAADGARGDRASSPDAPRVAAEAASVSPAHEQEPPLEGKRELRAAQRGDLRALGRLVRKLSWWLNARYRLRRATAIGRWVKVEGRPVIRNRGTLIIGDRAHLNSTIVRSELVTYSGGRLEIGARTFVNYGCSIAAHERISIGRNCLIGPYVNIIDNQYHSLLDRMTRPPSSPVVIGDNVWIGTRAIILPGVTIGDHAVIGAGAVVTHDVPARSVAAGNPARVLRTF
jgi:acetyltransferase-like isoleucine patch superfamily enzyme